MQKVKDFLLKNYKVIIAFICITIFLLIAGEVFEKEIINGDIIGYNLISKYLINDGFTPIMKIVTNLGGALFLTITTIILLLFIKNKKIGLSIFTNLAIITILNQVFKFILQRPRPTEFSLIDETGYSFPSAHSMISTAFYGYLIYLIYNYINNKYLKWISVSLLSCLIIMIGISRIYLGVHYTSDVIAGLIISIPYLILYTSIVNKILKGEIKSEK